MKRVRDAQCTISSPVVFASLKKIKRRRTVVPEMVRTQYRVLNQIIMSDKMRQLPRKKGGLSPHISVRVTLGQRAVSGQDTAALNQDRETKLLHKTLMSKLDLQLITRLVYVCVRILGEGAGFGYLLGVSIFLGCICQTLILESHALLCI